MSKEVTGERLLATLNRRYVEKFVSRLIPTMATMLGIPPGYAEIKAADYERLVEVMITAFTELGHEVEK